MLNLEKIELRGFKSFADKVEIPFKEGVTAIIGPNGCGKSNVSDAIRWTLGERSAKQLRGKSMQDVIFAGTEKRKSLSYCEVSLTFNNENQHIFSNLPFDKVVVTRKLDRSGDSEYYINNSRTLLSDIIDLFRDTGIGKEGYSIIGQGRVDEIMSAKPDERRRIFEEAAGISKFRAERVKAEKRLEQTALNLQTTNEVIAEIEKQIGPLRRQAETARKYAELREQLKHNEINLYIYNYENNQAIKDRIKTRIDASVNALKEKDIEYNECVLRYDDCIRESSGIDRKYDERNAELMVLKVGMAKSEGAAAALKGRIEDIQSQIARLNDDINSVDNQLIVSEKMIEDLNTKKSETLSQYMQTCKEVDELSAKSSKLRATLQGRETALADSNDAYVRAIEELGALKSNMSSLQAEKAIHQERARTINELLSQKKATLDEELTNLAIFDAKVKNGKEHKRELINEYNECVSAKMESQEGANSLLEEIALENKKISASEERLRIAIDEKEKYSSYQNAVGNLMRDAKENPEIAHKILGVLAEVVSVPAEYETAIEYALGGAMQNVLVENEQDASDLITYLKQKNYGRVTFRPLSSCRPHTLTGSSLDALREPGCYGLASELLKYDYKYDGLVKTLLGTTVVVNNIGNAIRIYKKYNQAFKIVTLDGEIFSRGGEITGGSRRNQTQGLLSQEKKIEETRANLERAKKGLSALVNRKNECEQEVRDAESRLEELNSEISAVSIEISVNEEKASQSAKIAENLQTEISEGAHEYEIVKIAIGDIENKLDSIDELEKLTSEKKAEYTELLASSKTESTKSKDESQEVSRRLMEMNIQKANQQNTLAGYDSDLFRITREKESLEEEKLDAIAQLKIEQTKLESIMSAPERASVSREDEERIKALENEISELSKRKHSITDEITALDAQKTEIFNQRNELIEKKTRDEGMMENVDIEMNAQQTHILEEYNLTYAGAVEFKDPEFKSYGALTVISDLKKAMQRLGDINSLAEKTLGETEERLSEQIKQRDDIEKACEDVKTIIASLTERMRDQFMEAFEKISENFKGVFSQLFGGGKGELRLDTKETDDVLEAGIEIFAQPPGKKLQNIGLLSGGERALTAIAILFAILRLKPMPFCVLDEIEAALDDANVNLFAEFLKKFSDFTQFIVITHRKPTMRHADTIFGVTMEEKGVTKIVSIEFEEAVKHATTN
ncbi:MAG: chromosome segregation protein SMC [Firmicutes bacterium]|nr:chromosome segregation protein SMC [Bacillota bacterium]MCM1393699.1 chromosome segregation protein SMC [[Eubacterium] siraeum]